jgi:hypothetical protein
MNTFAGGLTGQSGLTEGLSPGQVGGLANIAFSFEGNVTNKYYNVIYDLGSDTGFANDWGTSKSVIMG